MSFSQEDPPRRGVWGRAAGPSLPPHRGPQRPERGCSVVWKNCLSVLPCTSGAEARGLEHALPHGARLFQGPWERLWPFLTRPRHTPRGPPVVPGRIIPSLPGAQISPAPGEGGVSAPSPGSRTTGACACAEPGCLCPDSRGARGGWRQHTRQLSGRGGAGCCGGVRGEGGQLRTELP